VEGYFTWQAWEASDPVGTEVAHGAYQVLEESGAQSRFEVAIQRGLVPLVGRQAELSLLHARWAEATDGLGQVVLVTGEPGIGKSRLVRGLYEHLAAEPHIVVEWRCSPYAQQSPLHPVVAHLHRVLHWRLEDPPAAKLQMLEETLVAYGFTLPEVVPLLAALLALPLPERYPPLALAPQRQRDKTLEALLAWLLTEANRQPVLFIVEDLHWSDPSTLEFLTLLLDRRPTARLLSLLTCRPEFAVPWGFHAHLSSLTLNRLPQSQVAQMIVHVAGGKALPPEVVAQIAAKTDGVPLFVEEITKTVLESGLLQEREAHYELTRPLSPLAIPATLHDSLMARLDRLSTVKAVAQLGATIGRTFAYDLLETVAPLDAATLQQGLRQLVEAELVYQHGVLPQATYTFKHALIQDAAYQSLLHSTRQQYHQRIAQVLAEQFPHVVEAQPELLAHHYTEADLREQAIVAWQRAGLQALQRSAHAEAIAHLTKGLALLQTLPITAERLQQELELHTALGPALMVTMGHAAPEVAQVYTRARELCQQVGDTPQLFTVLWGLWRFYAQCGKLHTGQEMGAEFLRRAQRVPDPVLLLQAHHILGNTLFLVGELERASTHLEAGIALYHPQQHRTHVLLYGGHDPGVCCQSFAAYAAWVRGYSDQALQWGHAALTLAQELSHPFSLTLALQQVAVLDQFLRRGHVAQERSEACITIAAEQGFSEWFAIGMILRGWALTMQRQGAEGMAQIRQGLGTLEAKGSEVKRPYWLALLTEAYGTVGQHEAGCSVLAEALAVVDKTDERFYEAELYRLKGELTLQAEGHGRRAGIVTPPSTVFLPPDKEAEICFQQALAIARYQRAKAWELRAAMSLARLWQRQGKRAEAYELLAPVYGWFTEGFDTADLQEAKVLLEALASAV
jgi:predicted ATPase